MNAPRSAIGANAWVQACRGLGLAAVIGRCRELLEDLDLSERRLRRRLSELPPYELLQRVRAARDGAVILAAAKIEESQNTFDDITVQLETFRENLMFE